jgi:hypothetical protein
MAIEWEHRKPGEMTTIYLGRVLEEFLGLRDMARRAREGHFDDYFCPPELADGMELHRLVYELEAKAKGLNRNSPQIKRIFKVREAVIEGEFDATKEEAERWGASKEGQETFRKLIEGE